MPKITLPDGSSRSFNDAVTIHDVAADIGPGLAKAALAGKVDGELVDTSYLISKNAEVAIITAKSDEALELIRHDAAHVMAQAVQELFPGTQVTIVQRRSGFYYDCPRNLSPTTALLKNGCGVLWVMTADPTRSLGP